MPWEEKGALGPEGCGTVISALWLALEQDLTHAHLRTFHLPGIPLDSEKLQSDGLCRSSVPGRQELLLRVWHCWRQSRRDSKRGGYLWPSGNQYPFVSGYV